MPEFGFLEEIKKISKGGPISDSFFQKVENLARYHNYLLESYPYSVLEKNYSSFEEDGFLELRNDFIVNCLFKKGNERIRYFIQLADMDKEIDGLMVTVFRQYLNSLLSQENLYQANIIRRINSILRQLEKSAQVERDEIQKQIFYRRYGNQVDSEVSEEELNKISNKLPPYKRIQYNPGKKISPIIGQQDLKMLHMHIFKLSHGWIKEQTLWSFFIKYLSLPEYEFILSTDDYINEFSNPEGIDCAKSDFRDIYDQQLTQRQKKIFKCHFIHGQKISEIASSLDVKKSTVYSEIKTIKNIFKK